ncbi:epidermal retinol dehydrogenase 2-like [Brevipalpus obovatus]|uniref:epidermal retinol dehydrogenase 2-like n=1 Tax=Brevipalpus obovatus TaxID=246614 RepID=UPI003D9F5930
METLKVVGLIFYHWFKSIALFFIPRHLRLKDVSSETVLITGAGSGIGRLLAIKLASMVDNLVLWDIDEPRLQETGKEVQKAGGKCKLYTCDLSRKESVHETVAKVKNDVGPITMIINNAGIVVGKPILELSDDNIRRTFEVNTLSHFWIIRSFLPDMMKKNHGHIVSLASVASFVGSGKLTDYSASKAAAYSLQESLYLELGAAGYDGIKFTSVCPYLIGTGMFHGASDKVIPMLTPEYVTDQIIEAIRTDQYILVLPRLFYFILALKSMIPIGAGFYLSKALGGLDMMKNFSGRNNNNERNGHAKVN